MVKIKPKVVIDKLAKAQLKEAYTYIKLDSLKNAEKVKAKILASIMELTDLIRSIRGISRQSNMFLPAR